MDHSPNKPMTPSRPYLLRAIYSWLLDNELTPQIMVNAFCPGVQVPQQFVRDGQIVLNIAPHAVGALALENDALSFNARFGGVPHQVYVPMAAVLAIHARENHTGTIFEPEDAYEAILNGEVAGDVFERLTELVDVSDGEHDDTPEPPPTRGRPSLRVVK
jgi:stringent starvation protein B